MRIYTSTSQHISRTYMYICKHTHIPPLSIQDPFLFSLCFVSGVRLHYPCVPKPVHPPDK